MNTIIIHGRLRILIRCLIFTFITLHYTAFAEELTSSSQQPELNVRLDQSDLIKAIIRKDLFLTRLKAEKQHLLDLNSDNATLSSSEEEDRTTELKILDMRIKQIQSLDLVISKSAHAILQLSKENITFNKVNSDNTIREIRQQNAKIREEMIEASFEASKDYEASKDEEDSINKNKQKEKGNDDIVGDLIKNLDKSVEKLESSMQGEDKFSEGKKVGKLETVVKIGDQAPVNEDKPETGVKSETYGNKTETSNKPPVEDSSKPKAATTIIDAENNQYVLIRSNDPTLHFEDIKLFHDIVLLICVAYFMGILFDFCRLPAFFGYVGAGMFLGPPGLNKLEALVQLETIAQFGVLLILFDLGVEFSLEKLRKHWRITVIGGLLMLAGSIISAIILGLMISTATFQLSVFLGSTVALSSTTVVLKSLEGDIEKSYGRAMMGILILQDVALGLMLAFLPVLAMSNVTAAIVLKSLALVLMKSLIFIVSSWFIGKVLSLLLNRIMKYTSGIDLQILGNLTFCFIFIWACEYLSVSIEVGCFMAGVVISHTNSSENKSISRIDPLRDFFGCLFFASIGIHVYPSFLVSQAPLLILLTMTLMGFKILIAFSVLKFILKLDSWTSIVIGVGLSQISEFAFVLASRAKVSGILNKEMYYTLLGVTSLSLLLTPFAWKVVRATMKQNSIRRMRRNDDDPLIPLNRLSRTDPSLHENLTERNNRNYTSSVEQSRFSSSYSDVSKSLATNDRAHDPLKKDKQEPTFHIDALR